MSKYINSKSLLNSLLFTPVTKEKGAQLGAKINDKLFRILTEQNMSLLHAISAAVLGKIYFDIEESNRNVLILNPLLKNIKAKISNDEEKRKFDENIKSKSLNKDLLVQLENFFNINIIVICEKDVLFCGKNSNRMSVILYYCPNLGFETVLKKNDKNEFVGIFDNKSITENKFVCKS